LKGFDIFDRFFLSTVTNRLIEGVFAGYCRKKSNDLKWVGKSSQMFSMYEKGTKIGPPYQSLIRRPESEKMLVMIDHVITKLRGSEEGAAACSGKSIRFL